MSKAKRFMISYAPQAREITVRTKDVFKYVQRMKDLDKVYSIIDLKEQRKIYPMQWYKE